MPEPELPPGEMPVHKLSQVEIQVASWCNRECTFCPSGTFPVPKKRMGLSIVDRIISELETIQFSNTIGLHLMCEPLMHNKFPEIVKMFRERLPGTFIRAESNGDALKNMDRLESLFDSGLNEILINCYDSQEQFTTRSKQILALKPTRAPIWYWNKYQRFPSTPKRDWRVVRLRAFYDSGYTLSSWSGLVAPQRPEKLQFPLQLGCNRPSTRLHINYLGDILVCNNDWKFEVVTGNITQLSLRDALNTPTLRDYRINLANKNRTMKLCQLCDSGFPRPHEPGYPPPDRWASLRGKWLDWSRSWIVQRILHGRK